MKKFGHITHRRKQFISLAGIAVAGVFLFLFFFFLTRGLEHKQLYENFMDKAILHTEILKKEMGLNLFELNEVRALFKSSREVTMKEFGVFVDTILSHHPYISTLAWAPRSKTSGEKFSFPIKYIEPPPDRSIFEGFDLASEPALLKHLEQSWETGQMAGMGDISEMKKMDEKLDYLAILPVYSGEVTDSPTDYRYDMLRGFIVGGFNSKEIISEFLSSLTSIGINSIIFRVDPGGKSFTSMVWSSTRGPEKERAYQTLSNSGRGIKYETEINLAGYRLRILCTPTSAFMDANTTIHPHAILGIGLLFTLSLIIYIFLISERNVRIKDYALGLEKSEKSFRGLVENSLTGMFIIQNEVVVYKNREQKAHIIDLPDTPFKTELKGFHPDDVKSFHQIYNRINSGSIQFLDTELRFFPSVNREEKRSMKWIFCRGSAIEYMGKKAVLFNMMDITSAKELELRQQDKMASLGRMASVIAHEIRSPLSGINIYLNTLKKIINKDESNGKINDIFGKIQLASDKIEAVMKRSMDFARPGKAKFGLNDLNKPINDAIILLSSSLKSKQIEIEKTLYENLPKCFSDPRLIEQAVLNLINNSVEAMENGRKPKIIMVSSSSYNNHIIVKISDSGPGIPVEKRNLVYEPFFSTKSENSGLGLSICNRIILDHGGSLSISESRWGGAKFTIELPRDRRKHRR